MTIKKYNFCSILDSIIKSQIDIISKGGAIILIERLKSSNLYWSCEKIFEIIFYCGKNG